MAEIPLALVAKELGITKQALDYHRRANHITARKAGRFWLADPGIAKTELEEYLSRPGQRYRSKLLPKEPERIEENYSE